MSLDLKDLEATPSLTLDPLGEMEPPKAPEPPREPEVKPDFDESILSAEERKMVDDFAAKIDLTNSNVILQYGAGAQKKWRISQRRRWKM